MPRLQFVTFIVALLSLSSVHAFDTSRIEDPAVRACAERALPTATARQIQKVEVIGANGYVRESRRELFWRRSDDNDSRILVRVLEPLDEQGVAVLINDDADRRTTSYMTYSPKLKRVRRVTGESFFGSILGTDFTYEDFSYYYRVDDREQVERMADAMVEGHPAYLLETTKADDNSNYSVARFYVDKAICLPVRSDFIAHNRALRKQLLVDRDAIEQVDGHWVPFRTTMIDHKLDTRRRFTVEEIDIDPELDMNLFEITALKQGH
ncbi:MAG: outer membrane lipoprotein-sorting protein [Gammaproteobacteria bacterium]